MKNIFLLIVFSLLTTGVFAQSFIREIDPKTKKVVLRGQLNFKDLANESNYHWFRNGVNDYQPNVEIVNQLHDLSKNYHFVVFGGTWCEDTQDLLPKFYKVIHDAQIDLNSIELFGVNRLKEALNTEHKAFKIERVPTFIVYFQDTEVGRITESVSTSIEEELANILQKDVLIKAQKEKERLAAFDDFRSEPDID